MSLVDSVMIQELAQTEVDPKTNSTTIYTGLNFPDGGQGFIIVGRIQKDRKKTWGPLKDIIQRIDVIYEEKFNPIQPPAEEDTLLAE